MIFLILIPSVLGNKLAEFGIRISSPQVSRFIGHRLCYLSWSTEVSADKDKGLETVKP